MKLLFAVLVLVLIICCVDALPVKFLNDTALALQTKGSPSPAPTDTHGKNGASSEEAKSAVPDLLWPCLGTLAICFWNAIHPDVPAQKGHWHAFRNRVSLLKQSAEVASNHQDKQWTQAHGFLLIMGGLDLRNDEGLHKLNFQASNFRITLDGSTCNEEIISKINWSDVTEDGIKALSKADSFSKVIMAGAIFNFSLQCIVKVSLERKVSGLEVVTLAYTLLVMFVLWNWRNKPFNIQQALRVYTVDHPRTSAIVPADHVTFIKSIIKALAKLYEIKFTSISAPSWSTILNYLSYGFRLLFLDPVAPLMDNAFFFDSNPSSNLTRRRWGVGVATFLFGAVHCVFSILLVNSVEVLVWRGASVAITFIPFLLYACFMLDRRPVDNREVGRSARRRWISQSTIARFKYILMFLYVVCRAALIVLPLMDLRRYPRTPKGQLGWLEWIPHL